MVVVTNIEDKDLSPDAAEFDDESDALVCSQYSFELHDVNNAIANGLRRVICNELPGLALWFELEECVTDNPFAINNMIQNRIRLIPIDQTVRPDTIFELKVINTTPVVRYVWSNEIRLQGGREIKKPIFNNHPLFTLEPNKRLDIDRITIRRDYGYNFAGHSLACNVTSLALDQAPPFLYRDEDPTPPTPPPNAVADAHFEFIEAAAERVPSRLSNPRKYRITFINDGVLPSNQIVTMACDELISRMEAVIKHSDNIDREKSFYILNMPGYSHTTGNLLVRTIIDNYPSATATYSVESMARSLRVRILTDDDIGDVLRRATEIIADQYKQIRKSFA